MKHQVVFDIECGETTCASEPGVFCKFLLTQRFGTEYSCKLFSDPDGKKGAPVPLVENDDGWIQRHVDCVKHKGALK